MPSFRRWQELPPELLCRIGDSLDDLKCYVSARGACTAWRLALAPPSPSLLVVPVDASFGPSAASIPAHRAFELKAIPRGAQFVGSTSGWLALTGYNYGERKFSLFNPVTAAKIVLPPLIYRSRWVSMSKLVFAPNPASDDFAAAAICDVGTLAYVTAGARRWAVLDPLRLAGGDHLVDLIYHEKGRVYCLTQHGDVHVLRLPERRRREPIIVEDPWSAPARPLLSAPAQSLSRAQLLQQLRSVRPRRVPPQPVEPDLNAPATVEPLLSEGNLPFNPATSFALPYNKLWAFTSAKNLVFCEGNLYQIWRNVSCVVNVKLPGGGRHCVAENEVFVLRYYPDRKPCWDAVTDLGGYSVFVGRNNAVSMYAQGVPGLKGNCVYWIGWRGRGQGLVFDMATGRSTPCLIPAAGSGAPQNTVCWYFLSDMMN